MMKRKHLNKVNEVSSEVAYFFREARVEAGLTQKDVAKILKVESQYLSNFERGLCLPAPKYLPTISKIYKISPMKIQQILLKLYKVKLEDTFNQ